MALQAHLYSENMALQAWIVRQRQELDWFLQFQNERLRSALQHHRNREVAAMESKLAQATKRAMVLRECIARAEAERERWRKLAVEGEATVARLGDALERAGDAESSFCCGSGMGCKRCNMRRSSVLFLPCRHLCSCVSCEALLGSCPVCGSVKEASMEVFFA